ncbi:hypothetical protein SUNI508_00576 [Seiridium unicorne]|uniref:Uncharacterized protein n=1 Tax=Seiridium unicorne TaxID=138068 RepID=A0ABR2V7Y2_9PEZI
MVPRVFGQRSSKTPGKRELTVSTLPLRILSVVACTLPPVRCRSHSTVRRSTCGNICCILSTAASLALTALAASRPDGLAIVCEDGDPPKKKYRIARPDITTMKISEESEICSSAIFR